MPPPLTTTLAEPVLTLAKKLTVYSSPTTRSVVKSVLDERYKYAPPEWLTYSIARAFVPSTAFWVTLVKWLPEYVTQDSVPFSNDPVPTLNKFVPPEFSSL